MAELDFIVGLYDIVEKFGYIFVELIQRAIEGNKSQQESGTIANTISTLSCDVDVGMRTTGDRPHARSHPDCCSPDIPLNHDGKEIEFSDLPDSKLEQGDTFRWTNGDDDGSPEGEECPDPCSFTGALQFMEVSFEEALDKYLNQFEEHVQAEFLAFPGVRELLESEVAVRCFVPKEWKGLKGFEPLELDFKDTLPAEHPVRSRPINPRLFEHSKKEFDRLTKYLYTPSKSPWASPLVIAPKATAPFIRFCGDYVWLNNHIIFPQLYIPNVQHELEKAAGFWIFLDLDLTNSFHQIVLGPNTRQKLAVQTP
jgi:hypothetical protein